MKARKVKHLDPEAALAENAERLVRTRLDELYSFMPRAAEPGHVEALHDMRIAAKRLRYVLEITGPVFGPYATAAVKSIKEVQDLLGEIHDCDVQLPEVARFVAELEAADAIAVEAAVPPGAEDLDPALVAAAPHRGDYSGLAALAVFLEARRDLLFHRFGEMWTDLERKGFRARLEYALSERSHDEPLEAAAP